MRLRSITIALTWRGRCAWGQFKWWRLRDVAVAAADVVCRPVQERKVAKRQPAPLTAAARAATASSAAAAASLLPVRVALVLRTPAAAGSRDAE